jgi:hypothetical protein
MHRKTVGQLSTEVFNSAPEDHTPTEQMQENLTDWDKNIRECIDRALKETTSDFYVLVITKKERLMSKTLRNYFLWTHACPTPTYDQTVFKYHRSSDSLEFIWVLPAKDICEWMRDNALIIPTEQKELLNFVLGLYDDSLIKLAKKLNGEELLTPLTEKKQQWATTSPILLASDGHLNTTPEKKLVMP